MAVCDDGMLYRSAAGELGRGHAAMMCTVVAVTGSTPAAPGFQMLVGEQGRIAGTVGGGPIEHAAEHHALKVIAGDTPPGVRHFSLAPGEAGSVGMLCGGDTDFLFTPLDAEAVAGVVDAIAANSADAAVIYPLDGSAPRVRAGLGIRDTGARLIGDGEDAFALPLAAEGTVFVFGAGHVAQALVPVLTGVGFPCTVIDDRPEFADPALFPAAQEVRCLAFTDLAGRVEVAPGDRICVMTRGHAGDAEVLRFALTTPARYIGAMGSSKKREAVFGALEREGFRDVRDRVIMPIGLPLGGRTPAEIAISIAAQLIEDRAHAASQGPAQHDAARG